MDKSVPTGAAMLLDFIGGIEAPRGYTTIYGNNQGKLKTPITSRTLDQLIKAQSDFTRAYGSSASGRYQFMKATLQDLKKSLMLSGSEIFDANLQDRLGFVLLQRRGYFDYMAGKIDRVEFGKRLAQEWASLPVLANMQGAHRKLTRGQSYYAGDALNKSLIPPEKLETVLALVRKSPDAPTPAPVAKAGKKSAGIAAAFVVAAAAVATWWHELINWIWSLFT